MFFKLLYEIKGCFWREVITCKEGSCREFDVDVWRISGFSVKWLGVSDLEFLGFNFIEGGGKKKGRVERER